MAGVRFGRQFCLGGYILDFYSPQYRLGIEADGGQHYEDQGRQRDEVRTRELSKLGVKILSFNNREILENIEGVCELIQKTIEDKKSDPPNLNPLPGGERK